MCLRFGRQREVKTCAARGVVASPQAATMRFDDGAADAKSHAGPKGLGGKEGIEDLVRLLWRQPHAGIRDGHHNFLVSRSLRLDGKLARAVHVLHRVDAVDNEVHHHLLQLNRISHDLGKVFRQLGSERDGVRHCLAAQENDHLSNDLVYIYELPLRRTLLEEQAGVADDIRCTGYVPDYSRGCFARLFDHWSAGGEQAQAGPGVYDCRRNRLLHLVRQGSSQFSQGGHPADVCEIRLRLTQRFVGTFTFGYVARQFRRSNNAIRGILYRRNCQSNVEQGAVLAHADRLEVVDPLASREPPNNRSFFVTTIKGNNQRDVLANGLFRTVPEQAFCALIPTGDYAIQIFAHNRIVRRFHNGSQQTGRLLCSLAFGDVRRATHEFHQIPGCVQNRMTDSVDVFDNATCKKDSEFQLVMRLLSYRAIEYL